MKSAFQMHDSDRFNVYLYATSTTDHSTYRQHIESSVPNFIDVSSRSTQQIVERIVTDGTHILINLGGYTKGARNEVFALHPSPIQMSLMGYAGSLAAGMSRPPMFLS
jgi:protein O-GlcNAc transferase